MAFDAELQIVASQVVDISENAEQLSTAGGSVEGVNLLTLGRRGFPEGARFAVVIEETSADTAVDPVKFVLQARFDGTNWIDVATITIFGGPTAKRVYSVPIGLIDARVETAGVNDLQVRVAARYTDAGGTDDFTYSAYICGPNQFPLTEAL